jgi:exodeoxyribonuclease VII large subunit
LNLDLFDSVMDPEGKGEPPSPACPGGGDEMEGADPGGRLREAEASQGRGPSGSEEAVEADGEGSPFPEETGVWTVSQVNRVVRALLEDTLAPLWVQGEVANWKRASSGHCFFTLKDKTSQLRCVMWRGDASRLPLDPEQGLEIRAFGQLTVYEARGDFQLVAKKLETGEGEGLWRLAFERLKARLEEEGLLAPERKRPLPPFPQAIGVVTSLTGAALRDILTVLRRRAPWLRVVVAGARVQGEGAALEIARAVERLGGSGMVDAVIVGRGGGGVEDLWAFNEEPVARALAVCPVPVVSAVGHEIDFTIADLVADLRAPTPSAAAETVVPDKEEILRYLQGVRARLARGLRRGVDIRRRALAQSKAGFLRGGARITEAKRNDLKVIRWSLIRLGRELLEPRRRRLGSGSEALVRGLKTLMGRRRESLHRLSTTMDALSPLATLRRGYAVPLDHSGRVLRKVEDFPAEVRFDLRVVDGRVECEALENRSGEVSVER